MSIHVFVNKNCCPYKCFVELYFLTVYQDLFLIALLVVTVSVVREHRMQEYLKCNVYQMNLHSVF